MSFIMVINGPEATAGSTFIRLKVIGMRTPRVADSETARKMDIPTTRPNISCLPSQKNATNAIITPQTTPISRAVRISLSMTPAIRVRLIYPVAIPRTVAVEDCRPVLPPIAIMAGINDAMAMA